MVSFGIGSLATTSFGTAVSVGKAAFEAGLHAITSGAMSALDGGKFGSGFLSGMMSSLVSSVIQGIGESGARLEGMSMSSIGGMPMAMPEISNLMTRNPGLFKAIMLTSGGLTGGLSSTIAGGKFIDGLKQGLITSGLNHIAHATVFDIEENSKAKTALRKLNLDPKARPDFSKDAVVDLTVRDENLNQMYKNANYPSISLDPNQADPGSTISTGITLGQKAFQSYRNLYLTLGHEFIHAYHYASGMMKYWIKNFGVDRARYNTEREAYSWLQLYDLKTIFTFSGYYRYRKFVFCR
ncbi:hypothetical protein [Epilithonimonas hominis]|uniref:hypothetical protein n=1 Tax=Epilithonimonas hominis TaxID=420404 RepID=UPI000EC43444|nr:hypothetical protein [Epilithonimonas hominis]HAP96654.1 hypothetical protein [Chryseobacterium sp.]